MQHCLSTWQERLGVGLVTGAVALAIKEAAVSCSQIRYGAAIKTHITF